jgi:hypothetical protein
MSEEEHYFVFVPFHKKQTESEKKGQDRDKIYYDVTFVIRKVCMKWMNVLGEFCDRVAVEFDPLEKTEVYLVVVYADIIKGQYVNYKDCADISCFGSKQEADEYCQYVTNGGHKEVLEKGSKFIEAECITMPLDKV